MSRGRRARKVGLWALAFAIFFGSAEGLLRIREGPSAAQASGGAGSVENDWPWQPHPILGWAPYPGREVAMRSTEFAVRDRYNALGLLGPEIAGSKPPGTFRVLALGDSMTEGAQVPADQRFVSLIQEAITTRTGQTVEVLNAGRAGYQTDQELLYYELEGKSLGADVVLLFFFPANDVMGNTEADEDGAPKPRFHLNVDGTLQLENTPLPLASGPSLWNGIGEVLSRHLAIYRFGRVVWYARIARPPCQLPHQWEVFRREATAEARDAWTLTERLLARLRDAVARQGAQLAVVNLPDEWVLDRFAPNDFLRSYCTRVDELDPDAVNRRFGEACQAVSLRCLDLTQPFRERETNNPFHFPINRHLNANGHRLVASRVIPWLQEGGLLPGRR